MAKKNKPSKASEEILAALHSAVADTLLAKIRSGEVTSADLSVAIKFLKDNHIEADPEVPVMQDIVKELPKFNDEFAPTEEDDT
jgi:hypothetical protein